jgi:hypothetical protein
MHPPHLTYFPPGVIHGTFGFYHERQTILAAIQKKAATSTGVILTVETSDSFPVALTARSVWNLVTRK